MFARATRAKTLPVMLSPVAVGAALAWHRGAPTHWRWFVLTLIGASAMHLGANVLNDYYDERSGADRLARQDRKGVATGSGLIASGEMTAGQTLGLGAALFAAALAAGAALAAARGWPVLAFGATGALLAHQYVGPPLRYGYRGRGLGEIGIFASFGLLPVLGAYYVQAGRVEGAAVWASLVPGLLTTLVLYHHHLLHWRADRVAGKMTPVAALGPERALIVSGVAITCAYAVLALEVAAGLFPAWSLIGLLTAAPLAASWARTMRDSVVQNCLNLLGASLGASVLTGTAIAVSLAA